MNQPLFAIYGNGGGIKDTIRALKSKKLKTFNTFNDIVKYCEVEYPYFKCGTYNIYPYSHDDRIGYDKLVVLADYKGFKAQHVCWVIIVPEFGDWYRGG